MIMTELKPFLPHQVHLMTSSKKMYFQYGSVGCAKSVGLVIDAIRQCAKYPKNRHGLGSLTFKKYKKTIGQLLDDVLNLTDIKHSKSGVDWTIEFLNGSIIIPFEGFYENSSDKLQAYEFGSVGIDELTLMHPKVLPMLETRMRLAHGPRQIKAVMNPTTKFNFAYKNYLQPAMEGKRNDIEWLKVHIDENIYLPKDYIENLKRNFTGTFYKWYIDAEWVSAEGLVYPMFDAGVHIEDMSQRIEKSKCELFIGVDFGLTNPTAIVFVEKTSDGVYYVASEEYITETVTPIISQRLYNIWQKAIRLYRGCSIFIDPSAKDLITQLDAKYAGVEAANNSVHSGISMVSSMLHLKRLFLSPSCTRLAEEFGMYEWNRKNAENGNEVVIKKNDHGLDALRYAIMGAESRVFSTNIGF